MRKTYKNQNFVQKQFLESDQMSYVFERYLYEYGPIIKSNLITEYPECTDEQFQCGNKKCIPLAWQCNGEINCEDGSDEKQCENSKLSPFLHVKFVIHLYLF